MPTRPSFVARFLAAGGALSLLAGCPGLDEIFDQSDIKSVAIDPDPVPTPTTNAAADFNVTVSFDSERDNDRLVILIRSPHDDDRFKEIGAPVPCPNRREGGGCGKGTIAIPCTVELSQNFAGERSVGCGTSRADMGIGDYTLRVEMVNESLADTKDVTVSIR
jgi:hypothetical protein